MRGRAAKKAPVQEIVQTSNGPCVWAMIRLHDDVDLARHRDALITEIRSKLPGLEYFLPMHEEKIGARVYSYVLFEGYIFVKHTGKQDFLRTLSKGKGSYLDGPLMDRNGLALVKGSTVEGYRGQAREKACSYVPEVNETVVCMHEALERVEGLVVDVDHVMKIAHIKIKLRSRELIAPVKFANIQPKDEDSSGGVEEWLRLL